MARYRSHNLTLFVMYDNGRGVAQDDTQAVAWYRKAAEQGDANAQHRLGWMYENGRGVAQDYSLSMDWYQRAADQSYEDAQKAISRMYVEGKI